MGNQAVFLDRDGTINVDKEYLFRIEDFEFLPGVPEALRKLQQAGYLLIIITNQSGIARGYYTEEDFLKLNDWMKETLEAQGIHISAVYYCPHHPEAPVEKYRVRCNCRKPALGMFEQAARDFDLDLSRCVAIGDRLRDCEVCSKYGCRGFLVGNSESPDILEKVSEQDYDRIEYRKDLRDAVDAILSSAD